MSGGCLEDDWKVSGKCLKCVWKVSGRPRLDLFDPIWPWNIFGSV